MRVVELLRVREWVKNLFVFLPLIFGGRLFATVPLLNALVMFACFSLMASAVYILNDLHDRESDRLHPLKCRRPLAAGEFSPTAAAAICGALAVGSLEWCSHRFGDNILPVTVLGSYAVLNLFYTYWLKRHAIIDVLCIAVGFVLRVVAGGVACDIWVSPWLILMVFLLTLFIAFGKRRDDLVRMATDNGPLRKSAECYTLHFADTILGMLAGCLIVAYFIYSLSPEVIARFDCGYVFVTGLFVVAGLLRYLQLIFSSGQGGDPTGIVYRDPFIAGCCILWLASFFVIIYGKACLL